MIKNANEKEDVMRQVQINLLPGVFNMIDSLDTIEWNLILESDGLMGAKIKKLINIYSDTID